MASEKKPSIYDDRSGIGSSDELDEYGVWVKSEPQDLSSVSSESQESAGFSVPDLGELPDFDENAAETSSEGGTEGDLSFDDSALEIPDLDIPTADTESLDSGDLEPSEAGFTEVSINDFMGDSASGDLEEPAVDIELEEEPEVFSENSSFPPDNGPSVTGVSKTSSLKTAGSGTAASTDLSTQLLMKIADELSSIRTELSTLKKEFSAIKSESSSDEHGEAQRGGFFDEEDDEKIALTGDELDNILNTADFTEESGADATEGLAGDFSSFSGDGLSVDSSAPGGAGVEDPPLSGSLSDQEDITLNLGTNELDELGGESKVADETAGDIDLSFDSEEFNISLDEDAPREEAAASVEEPVDFSIEEPADEEIDISDLPDIEIKDSEELQRLREDGVRPMTSPPDDTSYLEEDPLAAEGPLETSSPDEITIDETASIDNSFEESSLDLSQGNSFEESSLDLSQAVIDEPDLSAAITENPVEEPSLEGISLDDADSISIDLDMEDSIDMEEADEEAPPVEEELELPVMPEEEPAGEKFLSGAAPLEENFDQIIPEGFIVEADDSQVPFEDDIEEEQALSEAGIESAGGAAEDADAGEEEEEEEPVAIPTNIKQELKTVLSYMDQLLESLPDDKIEEFAKSEYFDTYKKLFKELGLV
jgi:hypothetical protein